MEEIKREADRLKRKRERARRRPKRPKGTGKAAAAGVLLVLVLILGLLNAVVVMWEASQVQSPDEILSESTGNVYGMVTDTDGQPIEDAEITIINTHHKAFSNEEGWYFIEGVPVDKYRIQVDRANYTSVIKKVKVEENMPRPINFQLEEGTGVDAETTGMAGDLDPLGPSYTFSIVLIIFASVMAGIGASLSFKRTSFRMALVCAGIGVLSYGFILGSFLSIFALVVLALARPAFVTPKVEVPSEAPVGKGRRRRDETTFEEMEDLEDGPEGVEADVREARIKALRSKKADMEIEAEAGEAREPSREEPVRDAEVREDLKDKALESEDRADDTEADMGVGPKSKELKPAGPEMVSKMEKALKDTLESQEETETDLVRSVLQKLELDKPHEPIAPPKKRKRKKRGIKAHQKRQRCRVCVKPIIIASEAVDCECGRSYHIHCARNIVTCIRCGKDLKIEK